MVYIQKNIGIVIIDHFHRALIWRFLLKLPENRESYESMLQMGLHNQMREFRRKFPLKSESLSKSMEK